MNRQRIPLAAFAAVLLLSGCATQMTQRQITCAAIGAVVGGVGGAVAHNPWHGDDDSDELYIGAVAGAVVGGAAGALLCADRTQSPPTARATAHPSSGQPPLAVELRGVGTDSDGQITSYAWDFGDGTSGSGQRASHTYREAGSYTARLTVTDDDGLTGTATAQIRVAAPRAAPPAPPAPATPAKRIVLRGVNFDFDRAEIRPDADAILAAAADTLRENAGVRVQVAGHTDATGPDAYNQGLSERRARAVLDSLVARGVAASRLSPVGYGESRPVASNDTRDGRAQNRRVELNIMDR